MQSRTVLTPSWLTGPRRLRLYQIGGALTALMIVYGALTAEQAAVWLSLIGVIVLPAVAADNVTSAGSDTPNEHA